MAENNSPAVAALATDVQDRVRRALDVLTELAEDTDQSGAVRARSASAIVQAGVTLAKIAPPARSAGELTVDELEQRIEAARAAIQRK
jgi:hypothetical protein